MSRALNQIPNPKSKLRAFVLLFCITSLQHHNIALLQTSWKPTYKIKPSLFNLWILDLQCISNDRTCFVQSVELGRKFGGNCHQDTGEGGRERGRLKVGTG